MSRLLPWQTNDKCTDDHLVTSTTNCIAFHNICHTLVHLGSNCVAKIL